MALHLRRVQYFTDVEKSDLTGDMITYGDFYFVDDEDGFKVSLHEYYDLKKQYEEDNFDQTRLENAQSAAEYRLELERATQEMLTTSLPLRELFSRKILRDE